jgi:hypothetical protein
MEAVIDSILMLSVPLQAGQGSTSLNRPDSLPLAPQTTGRRDGWLEQRWNGRVEDVGHSVFIVFQHDTP